MIEERFAVALSPLPPPSPVVDAPFPPAPPYTSLSSMTTWHCFETEMTRMTLVTATVWRRSNKQQPGLQRFDESRRVCGRNDLLFYGLAHLSVQRTSSLLTSSLLSPWPVSISMMVAHRSFRLPFQLSPIPLSLHRQDGSRVHPRNVGPDARKGRIPRPRAYSLPSQHLLPQVR